MSRVLTALSVATVLCVAGLGAQTPEGKSCNDFLLPPRTSQGKKVGPTACRMIETPVTFEGRALTRLDIGVTGRVEGYLPKTGYYINYFTSAPDLVFPQGMNAAPILHGVGTYTMEKGHAMTLLYPANKREWNGKMYITLHGRGRSFKRGNQKAWNRNLDPANPTGELSKFELLMLRKGYGVAKTYRSSETLGGDIEVTLEDGTHYPERNLNDNAQVILDWAALSENVLSKRLGAAPSRTYFYGRSAGGRIGRSINYVPGLNVGPDGKPRIDGILSDDSATGLWQPIVMKPAGEGTEQGVGTHASDRASPGAGGPAIMGEGAARGVGAPASDRASRGAGGPAIMKDVLFTTDKERAGFVPQIDVTHQMYNAETPGERPDWVSSSYLLNKRWNAKTLRDKGLGSKHRIYEIRRVSHDGGEYLALGGKRGDVHILEISYLFDRFIDMLDAWVEKGVQPPPNRSDWAELGDQDKDGTIEHLALAMPEVACPLGVYFQFPPSRGEDGDTATSFAPFTGGTDLEPLDGRKVFVDMNANGIWDFRETPAQAWQRLGLLAKGEPLTSEKYASCVAQSADTLRADGFFSDATAKRYADEARKANLTPKSTTP